MMEMMPILSIDREHKDCPQAIPMDMLDNETAKRNHGQDLAKLKTRHGIGVHEALAIITKTDYRDHEHLSMEQAIAILNDLVSKHLAL